MSINPAFDDGQSLIRNTVHIYFGDSGMGDISRVVKGQAGHTSGGVDSSSTCPVCDGKRYTLVVTRKINQSQTIFERQDCHLCVTAGNDFSTEQSNKSPYGSRKRLSGTGYLRNKKRRRKDEGEGDPR